MICLDNPATLRELTKQLLQTGTIGFVPTMGALHEGHAALIQQCRQENDFVFVSIFVNPAQFNDRNDYQTYPLTLTADKALLEELGVDYLFLPTEKAMYPNGFDYCIQPQIDWASELEGHARPGHFAGMLTVVMKLLLLITPSRSYFGEKDYQQAKLVTEMVESFFLPTDIIVCPTVRASSGLPLSSRNGKLSQEDRQVAERIYRVLQTSSNTKLSDLHHQIEAEGAVIDYLEARDKRIFLAMRIGTTRIIDNFWQSTGPIF